MNFVFLRWCSALFCSAGNPDSFGRCVSKSSVQPWIQSILLSKNHQRVFVETEHTDHNIVNILSFDAAETRQQTPGGLLRGYLPDHNTICLFLFVIIWQSLFSSLTLILFWSAGDQGSFCWWVSKSLFQTWSQSIILSEDGITRSCVPLMVARIRHN